MNTAKLIATILIANRGEIASRVIRTCKKMGIRSVAIYSEADRHAPYVEEADISVFIGESPPSLSYLDQDKIIIIAKKVQADAIHPGYGFLSENYSFAQRCRSEGIIFIGPNSEAIKKMGSKSLAKSLMERNGISVVPGYNGSDQRERTLIDEAAKIGYPLLLKATAGGGGKGMRIVRDSLDIIQAIKSAKREANNAFGNDELIIEKYIENGRHIEFQILGDQHNNIVHLLERECSIQRRYQKIIEESPSPIMDDMLRHEMGESAVKAAKALNYDNAGTVEFIYDEKNKQYYFLEVNTRLQVEHPVTEEITGIDLVQLQIESSQGVPLSFSQKEVEGQGYAVEVRLYSEDAANDFLPVTGKIEIFKVPEVEGLRVESAIQNGTEVSIYYDPMIAKLIVWDTTRLSAHRKMKYVLKNLVCLGLTTNQDFLLRLFNEVSFQKGEYDTQYLQRAVFPIPKVVEKEAIAGAAIASTLYDWHNREMNRTLLINLPSGWKNNFYDYHKNTYVHSNDIYVVKYRYDKGQFQFIVNEKIVAVKLMDLTGNLINVETNGIQKSYHIVKSQLEYLIHNEETGNIRLSKKDRLPQKELEKSRDGYEAPMPSQIVKVLVSPGQKVKAGDGLIILSSMKMENTIYANEPGVVEEIYTAEGESVERGFILLKLTPQEN